MDNRFSIYKQTPQGKTYFVSPETDVPVQDLKLFDVSPQVAQADEPEPAVLPTENPILEERWSYVLQEVQRSLGEDFTLETVKKTSSPSGLDRSLRIMHGDEVAEISIVHQTGINPEQAFSSDVLTVTYNGVSYPTVGRAAYAASLDLKPEPTEAPPFSVDEALPLLEQWNVWRTEIIELVVAEGMLLEIKNEGPGRVRFLVHYADREESVTIQRHLTAKGGGYTSKHATITYAAHEFKDPLTAVKAVISDLKLPKEKLKITMPWEKHEHEDDEDSHDGHAH